MSDVGKVGELIDLLARLDLFRIRGQQNREYKKLPQTGQSLLGSVYPSEPMVLG